MTKAFLFSLSAALAASIPAAHAAPDVAVIPLSSAGTKTAAAWEAKGGDDYPKTHIKNDPRKRKGHGMNEPDQRTEVRGYEPGNNGVLPSS